MVLPISLSMTFLLAVLCLSEQLVAYDSTDGRIHAVTVLCGNGESEELLKRHPIMDAPLAVWRDRMVLARSMLVNSAARIVAEDRGGDWFDYIDEVSKFLSQTYKMDAPNPEDLVDFHNLYSVQGFELLREELGSYWNDPEGNPLGRSALAELLEPNPPIKDRIEEFAHRIAQELKASSVSR